MIMPFTELAKIGREKQLSGKSRILLGHTEFQMAVKYRRTKGARKSGVSQDWEPVGLVRCEVGRAKGSGHGV